MSDFPLVKIEVGQPNKKGDLPIIVWRLRSIDAEGCATYDRVDAGDVRVHTPATKRTRPKGAD